jgi:hypothetical protein
MVGKSPNPVSIRVYKQKEYGELHNYLKLKYAPGCNVRSMDMPEQRAYELYELLHEYFSENFVE